MAYQNQGTTPIPEEINNILKDVYETYDSGQLNRPPTLIDFVTQDPTGDANLKTYVIKISRSGQTSTKDFESADNAHNGGIARFSYNLVDKFGTYEIALKDWLTAKKSEASFVDLLKEGIIDVREQILDKIRSESVQSSLEAPAAAAAVVGQVVTLDALNSTTYFEIREIISYGPAGVAEAGRGRVIGVDFDNNTITVADVANDAIAPAPVIGAGDELYTVGSWQNTALVTTADSNKMLGLPDFIPADAPGPTDSFLGVNRSVHPTRLSGSRLDFSPGGAQAAITDPLEQIRELALQMAKRKAMADMIYCSPEFYADLHRALGSQSNGFIHQSSLKVMRGKATVDFDTISVFTQLGKLDVVWDPELKGDAFYILNKGDWHQVTMNGVPSEFGIENGMTNKERTMHKVFRAYGFQQFLCKKPYNQGVGKLA